MDVTKVRNLGISAHVDSGKTTLTERVLFYTGRIHRIGEVKDKAGVGATMDFTDLERERGITIQSAATAVHWQEHTINIIDTPGHVDFTIEVERSLRVLDGAVLVLCAVAGVQAQSFTVDRQMRRYRVPCVAFINKMDRPGANAFAVVEQLRSKLGHNAVLVNLPIGAEASFEGVVDLLRRRVIRFTGARGQDVQESDVPDHLCLQVEAARAKLVEALAELDDSIMAAWLAGRDLPAQTLAPVIRAATLERRLTPVFVGSALGNKGVQPLLDGVCAYLPAPSERHEHALDLSAHEAEVALEAKPDRPLVALAFKLEDGRFGQLTYVRVYQGRLDKGATLVNQRTGKASRLGRLVRIHASELVELDSAEAGDIVGLFGIDCASGDTFTDGSVRLSMQSMHVPAPVISYAITPRDRSSLAAFAKALNRFAKEDPTFRVRRDEESNETIISGMGELQLEIYAERMRREYGVEAELGQPQVAYRETITMQARFEHTHSKQTGGPGEWARVVGLVRPREDRANELVDQITSGAIPRQYIPACMQGFEDALAEGCLLGAPVIGVDVALVDGKHHVQDSSERAFRTCARDALKQALVSASPTILEPIMHVQVEGPERFHGRIQTTLIRRRGTITSAETRGDSVLIEARAPLAEMFGYAMELRSVSEGQGCFSMELADYAAVPASVQRELIERRVR